MLQPLDAELRLHTPSGRLRPSKKMCQVLNRGLAKPLGFSRVTLEPSRTYTAAEPHRLTVHREICEHLAEVSTSDNLHIGSPSTLLRSLPVENEKCGGGRTETFPVLQYTRLAPVTNSQLTITVLDVNGKKLNFNYLCAVLHVKNGWRRWPRERQKMSWGGSGRSRRHPRVWWGRRRKPTLCVQAHRSGV